MTRIASTRFHRGLSIAFFFGTFMAVVLCAPRASAYTDYAGCASCHGDFRANDYFSLVDEALWGANAHDVHRFDMLDGDCATCHGDGPGFSPVLIGASAGGDGFPAIGCVGCHGRDADTGNDDISLGYGAGLRQHHTNALVTDCADCHSDADPANYTPVGEDVLPDYYFMPMPDAVHPNKPTNSCSPNGEEDYAGSMLGLDNDGNGLYDGNDPACAAAECGNGTIEPGEDCDDGNTLDGDCCNASCQFDPAGSSCPDGAFCNGDETCDGAGSCQAGTPVDCDDGVGCTDDSCDEGNDVCVHNANDDLCEDDGLFCTGTEFCDEVSDCSSTGDPCLVGTSCNELTDTCDLETACGDGIIDPGEDCDDGNTMDGDCCSASCEFEAAGSDCADGEFCNGDETCDGAGACQAGTPVDCSDDDGVDCTVGSCNEATDSCDNTPDNSSCDNGVFCDGIEVCDSVNDCQPGTPVDCGDGVGCTDDSCDEVNDVCVHDPNDLNCPDDGLFCTGMELCDTVNDCSSTGDPCADGTVCNEAGTCDPVAGCGDGVMDDSEECDDGNTMDGDCCSANCQFEPADSPCPDGEFCNGEETCDGAGTCQGGTPVDCSDGVDCTVDSCDEMDDLCVHTSNDNLCEDDGLFCSGQEICDLTDGCLSTGDPCPSETTCNEDTNTCDGEDGENKVTLCHIPKGNPANAHTITVNAAAVRAHLRHGDILGSCSAGVDQLPKTEAGSPGTFTSACSVRSGASNGAPLSAILLCLCALVLSERRRKRGPATGR